MNLKLSFFMGKKVIDKVLNYSKVYKNKVYKSIFIKWKWTF